jgi:hypothetical protein
MTSLLVLSIHRSEPLWLDSIAYVVRCAPPDPVDDMAVRTHIYRLI